MLLFLLTLYLIVFSPSCYVFMFLPREPPVEKIIKKYRYGCSDAHTSIDYRRCETTRKSRKTKVLESSRRSNLTRQAMSIVNKSTWLSDGTYVALYMLAILPNNVRKISLIYVSYLVIDNIVFPFTMICAIYQLMLLYQHSILFKISNFTTITKHKDCFYIVVPIQTLGVPDSSLET